MIQDYGYLMDKISITVSPDTRKNLENDMMAFGIFKKGKSIVNRNEFYTRLVEGYYDRFEEEKHLDIKRIEKFLKKEGVRNIKEAVVNFQNFFIDEKREKKKGEKRAVLSLKPTRRTERYISAINDRNVSPAAFLGSMFESYAKLPIYEREKIIFWNEVQTIEDAMKAGCYLSFDTVSANREGVMHGHKVLPYKLSVSREEMYVYLLCEESDKNTGTKSSCSYHLKNMKNLMINRYEEGTISPESLKNLEMMAASGPQYAKNQDVTIRVRLTEYGRTLYVSKIYQDRPLLKDSSIDVISCENDIFEFSCSEIQAFVYFRKFGSDAEIIEPKSLREKMADHYRKGFELYYKNPQGQ